MHPDRALRIGVGGPVGSGKTALVATLCRALSPELAVAVVTNDIYTTEDAETLRRLGVLDRDRIAAVQTGCCPHTAIRDDISANLDALEELENRLGPLDLLLLESGGDNLTATFSRGLVDRQIFVLDVAGGDKVPRKGGPGVTMSDLLVVNKTDLAPFVGADLGVMERDARARRGNRPMVFSCLVEPGGARGVTAWVRAELASWRRPAADAIEVVEADPGWKTAFQVEHALLIQTLGDVFLAVEHIGSTSVPGLAAKPVVDMMAGARSLSEIRAHLEDLARIGYEHRPDAFAGNRLFFRKHAGGKRSHHLHVVPAETLGESNEILFRDWLRSHPDVAADYGRQKKEFAARWRGDRQAYVEAKTAFVQAVVDAARQERGLPRVDVWEP